MKLKDLKNQISKVVKEMYFSKDTLNPTTSQSFNYSELLDKFPQLNQCLIELLTKNYTQFISNIEWIAPRPTTFKLELKNKNHFILIWLGNNFSARISGTNYNLSILGEKERAIKAIQELFIVGPIDPNKGSVSPNQELHPSNSGDSTSSNNPLPNNTSPENND